MKLIFREFDNGFVYSPETTTLTGPGKMALSVKGNNAFVNIQMYSGRTR